MRIDRLWDIFTLGLARPPRSKQKARRGAAVGSGPAGVHIGDRVEWISPNEHDQASPCHGVVAGWTESWLQVRVNDAEYRIDLEKIGQLLVTECPHVKEQSPPNAAPDMDPLDIGFG